MAKKTYTCDGGSICIGTKASRAFFPNNYGDGGFYVYTCSNLRELKGDWMFKGAVEGTNINVYKYDCLSNEECENHKNILFTLTGRWGVYAQGGDIALERWN